MRQEEKGYHVVGRNLSKDFGEKEERLRSPSKLLGMEWIYLYRILLPEEESKVHQKRWSR